MLCNNRDMTLPPLERAGGAYEYLPAGDHEAALDEVEHQFGCSTFRRRELMTSLREVVDKLRGLGVTTIWIDGSFVSSKQRPGDVDVIYAKPIGADTATWGLLAPSRRDEVRKYYRCHLWEYPSYGRHAGRSPKTIKEFFETDDDDVPKGHILLRSDDDQE